MLKLKFVIFIILFTSWSLNVELNEVDTNSDLMEKLKDTPLRASYRHKHKNKMGSTRHGVRKRLAETENDIRTSEDPQCAILYKNNAPVGILEPFQDSYKFLSVKGEPTFVNIHPIFSDYSLDEESDDNKGKRANRASFSDENYPSIFTKFRLHNSKDLSKRRMMYKRENDENPTDSNQVIRDAVGASGIEEKLQSVLDDMGLLDEYSDENVKRDVEDENLELGTNRIDLIKEGKGRARRDDQIDVDLTAGGLNGTDLNDLQKGNDSTGFDNNSEILNLNMNDTKTSTEDVKIFKRSNDCKEKLSPKVLEYEKRVERDIRDKIKKIKEEVTREIDSAADDPTRQKRQIFNTLLEEETKEIDPNFNTEENGKIHIRKKRNANYKTEDYDNRSKRNDDVSNLDNNEDEAFTDNENAEELDDCYCDESDNDCECLIDPVSSNIVAEEEEEDLPIKYTSKKAVKQLCNCDKDGNHCKCSNSEQNFDYYEDEIESKSIDKKSIESTCNCDKNDENCKCRNLIDDDYSMYEEDENGMKKRSVKARKFADAKSFQNGEYFVDLQPDLYRIESIDESRNKRNDFDDLLERESARKQLIAVKQRSMLPLSRYRRRTYKEEPRKLTDMSGEDLFGALPQSFGGELNRYKRVKRSKRKK
ncbi:protein PFC0760c-like [Diorhabda carinulata]|uniref:protein PFC0760c-like n=1 Tax=Diorhabda carinulata TaxID=1163345 RepID=UPI0025A1294A|nr:protein PFC0760c-like [Diorhabda carinulata]